MKRILLLISFLAITFSCSKEIVDNVVNEDLAGNTKEVTLAVSMDDAQDSRVSISDLWAVAWEEGDALAAWNDADNTIAKFEMVTFDASAPTFTGSTAETATNIRLVYPYDAAVAVDGTNYPINIAAQTGVMDKTYLASDLVEAAGGSTTMKHIGAYMNVTISFTGVDATGGYKLIGVELCGVPASASFNMTDGTLVDEVSGNIVVTLAEPVAVSAGTTVTVPVNVLPFEVAAGESISVKLRFSSETYGTQLMEIVKSNATGAAISFARGTYNTTSVECDCTFGTSSAPWGISTAAQLAAIDANTDYVLTNDIDLGCSESSPWTSIETYSGTFNGNGYTISGLYGSNGIFAILSAGVVKNLTVEGTVVSEDTKSIGGIVGAATATYIYEIDYSTFTQTLVGIDVASEIVNCCSKVNVTSTGFVYGIGGVVGYLYDSKVINSCSLGDVNSPYYSGGIVGNSDAEINSYVYNCYSSGTITGEMAIGGIIGGDDNNTYIENCYSSATIVDSDGWDFYFGGIVGMNAYTYITNCYWNKDISDFDGYGYTTTKTVATNLTSMTTAEMTADSFTATLNTNTASIDGACAWVSVDGGYPTFDYLVK